MNAVEIADAVADLFAQPFDAAEFPFQFLEAFGNKEVTIKRLRKGDSNSSDVLGGVLQKSNIHIAVAEAGAAAERLKELKNSPQTAKAKAKFVLATDGQWLSAEDLRTGEALECEYKDAPAHFGFFLELAGISTVKEIKDNPIDIRATGRLNKLYLELLKENPDWQSEARRADLNHFFARLIFCFFAEDTGIFLEGLFTNTVKQMTEPNGSNTAFVLEQAFRAMNLRRDAKERDELPLWTGQFPYVNGHLFSGGTEVPRFTRIARSYLLRAGELNWKEINPDIFGSMIQAVADDEERGALGMHYTSVPNILKVLNPLFLDDLRTQLEAAGDSLIKLLNLRKRIAHIRVFDPACGSGNFLVIAYKQMREIEAKINQLRGEKDRPSEIPLTNFRGIEIRDFAAEVARLALIIAEYQADEKYRGKRLALAEFLPLKNENWIWRGNALRLDWTTVCPPTGDVVKVRADNLFGDRLEQTEMDFANAGGETYLCGNPPYKGSTWQTPEQKAELKDVLQGRCPNVGNLDYVAGWFVKAADYLKTTPSNAAFVTTNSICQGQSVPDLWPVIYTTGSDILFAHTSFRWANLASYNAGVTVAIVGIGPNASGVRRLFVPDGPTSVLVREGSSITPYLTLGATVIVEKRNEALSGLTEMEKGSQPTDGGHLLMNMIVGQSLVDRHGADPEIVRPFYGSDEFINGLERRCLWVTPEQYQTARQIACLEERFNAVAKMRRESPKTTTQRIADRPYRFGKVRTWGGTRVTIVPAVSSERREWFPVGYLKEGSIVSNLAFALYDAPLWNLALIASRLHLVWIGTVCGKLKTDYRYSNTLGWNTFPVPTLTQGEKDELTRCAEEILLARERHFPATIADLYDPEAMPDDLRRAHERNDETLERIYIGRRFKNDTERLEKLFEMYTAMVAKADSEGPKKRVKKFKANDAEALL